MSGRDISEHVAIYDIVHGTVIPGFARDDLDAILASPKRQARPS